VSDSINLAHYAEVMLIGDVDQNGNPISTIKANSIATPHVVNAKDHRYRYNFNYYPVILKDEVEVNGAGPST
jgi:hypothetical protein